MPFTIIHKIPVLLGFLIEHEAHGSTAPNLANPTTSMAVQHETRRIKTLNRTHVTSFGINGVFTVRGQGSCCCHGKSQFAILPIIHKSHLRAIVPVGIVSSTGISIEMTQGAKKQAVRHIGSTFLGQHEKGNYMSTGSIEMPLSI